MFRDMKRLTLKFSSGLLAVVLTVGMLFVPQKAQSIGAVFAFITEELTKNIGEWVKSGEEVAKLMVLIENTKTQIKKMSDSYSKASEQYDKWREGLDELRALRDGLQSSKQVYYAAQSVSRFYSGIGDYWKYAKENGFSNYSGTIRTLSQGIRYAQAVTRDAIAITNIIMGKDEDGHKVQFDAATTSSKIRSLYQRINRSHETWARMVEDEGLITGGAVVDRAASQSTFKPDGFNSVMNYDYTFLGAKIRKDGGMKDEYGLLTD